MDIVRQLRHYRRHLVYPFAFVSLSLALFLSAQTPQPPAYSLDLIGLLTALCGQILRFWTWGTNPTKSGMRTRGPYPFIRHPLYVGNFLIGSGLLLILDAPLARFIFLPFLALLYLSSALNEEKRLKTKMGAAYVAYQAAVPRFLPWRGRALTRSEPIPFDWKHARAKERDSICGWVAGAMSLEVYEALIAEGVKGIRDVTLFYLVLSSLLGLWSLSRYLRKRKGKDKIG